MSAEPVRTENRLSIVMPAYNEEENILKAIDHATEVAERLFADHEIIVVDDGCTDDTARLVQERSDVDSRVRLLRHDYNRGYGEALRTGFKAAKLDLLFFTDSDNQFVLEELEYFIPWIERVDVVAGYRANRQDTFMRHLNARAWNYLVRVLFYVPVRDIDCAFKLFRREIFDSIDLSAVGAILNTELMVKIGRAGFGVVEIPVTHLPRTAGKARGASPAVIAKAFAELFLMYTRLKAAGVEHPRPVPRSPHP